MRTLVLCLFLCACVQAQEHKPPKQLPPQDAIERRIQSLLNPDGMSIQTRLLVPEGFERVLYSEDSFGYFLQHFPLKPPTAKVMLFDGREKYNQDAHLAVLDIDIGQRDLQQCADAIMRLRAEYLWQNNRFEDIRFNFTNGFQASYSKWRAGYRIRVEGNKVTWVQRNQASTSYQAFRKYLNMVFAYAGTLSLAKELPSQALSELEVGDVFIQGGSPGHAILVVDKAIHSSTKEVLFCLAQSYMPAQSIHILKNPSTQKSPWYSAQAIETQLVTPEWTFRKSDLKRF